MKFPAFLLIIFWINNAICQDIGLSGRISDTELLHNKIYLLKISNIYEFYSGSDAIVVDSAILFSDGTFSFPNFNILDTSYFYRLNVIKKGANPGNLIRDFESNNYIFLVNENIPIYINADGTNITRTYQIFPKTNVISFVNYISKIEDSIYIFKDEFNKKLVLQQTEDERTGLIKKFQENLNKFYNESLKTKYLDTINHIKDTRLIFFLLNHIDINNNFEEEISIFENIETTIKQNHPYYKHFLNEIYKIKKILPVGSKAPDFYAIDLNGNNFQLRKDTSKLLLVDFWASWCQPCRQENKEVVKPLFENFSQYGFNVVSISADSNKEAWLKAILNDKMNWINILGIQNNSEVKIEEMYKVSSYPTTFLIDKDKKIIAKNIRGLELEKFIESYFNKKKN